jgi:hypothetical protein
MSFSLGRLSAIISVSATSVAFDIRGAPSSITSAALRSRNQMNNAAAMRLLPSTDPLVVVVVEQAERLIVFADDRQQRHRFVARQIAPAHGVGDQANRLVQVAQAFGIGGVTLDDVVAQDAGGPNAELRATLGAGRGPLHRGKARPGRRLVAGAGGCPPARWSAVRARSTRPAETLDCDESIASGRRARVQGHRNALHDLGFDSYRSLPTFRQK